jgi:hypothetical protein
MSHLFLALAQRVLLLVNMGIAADTALHGAGKREVKDFVLGVA